MRKYGQHFRAEFHNCYGQTETSEVSVWEGATGGGPLGAPLGRQIGIYRLFVLDTALNPVPAGVPGELYVAGCDGLARGYHGRPDWTAESFLPNPYPVSPGERIYRTGDLARRTAAGVIEYLGRVDAQTKIRGCRVEPMEVEAVLERHSSVTACAVIAAPDASGVSQLVAYLTGDRRALVDLSAHAAKFLPGYMRPAAYVYLNELPRTPSGKLDRLKLPPPKTSDFALTVTEEVPQSPLEAELTDLWKSVLGLTRLGRRDNFFGVGGNSLKSIQVLARIKSAYNVEISVRDFFASPTVEALAAQLERALLELVKSMSQDEVERQLGEARA
jgi:acyl carrier protein